MHTRVAALALVGVTVPAAAHADPDLTPLPPVELDVIALVAMGSVTNLYPPHSSAPVEGNMWGPVLAIEVGYRFFPRFSAGATVRAGRLTGSYQHRLTDEHDYTIVALDFAAYIHARPADRVWVGFFTGPHLDHAQFDDGDEWERALGFGVEIAGDLFTENGHWASLVGTVTASRFSDFYFGSVGVGLAYRR
jgi:hypothetical protein